MSEAEIDVKALRWPADFQTEHPEYFRSSSSLRNQLACRNQNGLLASGAVVEARGGPMIHPQRYAAWWLTPIRNLAA